MPAGQLGDRVGRRRCDHEGVGAPTSSRWEIAAWSGAGSPGKAPRAGSGSNSSTSTGAPVMPSKVARPTKFRLAGVCTTRTECPALVARRTISTAL